MNNSYYIGELYAIYEKVFKESNMSVNQYNHFMQSPRNLVPRLDSIARNCKYFNKYKEQISKTMNKISEFPNKLSIDEQSYFVLGYHQKMCKLDARES